MKLFKQQEAQTIVAHGKALTCAHCGHDRFWTKKVLLNSSISAFLVLIGQTVLHIATLVNSVGDWSGL